MESIYLDTSLLVSVYIPEKHSQGILGILKKIKNKPYVSRLTETEFCAALALKRRTKELTQPAIDKAISLLENHLALLVYEKIYITDLVFTTAIQYLQSNKTNLRTLDALHLACSATIGATLLTADKVLAQSANQLNLSVQLV